MSDEKMKSGPVCEELKAVSKVLKHYLENDIHYRSTGKDPKNDGYAYVEIPGWAVKNLIAVLDTAARARENQS